MTLSFQCSWIPYSSTEGPLAEQQFRVEIKEDISIPEKQEQCERFLRFVGKMMKE